MRTVFDDAFFTPVGQDPLEGERQSKNARPQRGTAIR